MTVYVPPNSPDTSEATVAERLDDLLQRVFAGCEAIRQQALKVSPERPADRIGSVYLLAQ